MTSFAAVPFCYRPGATAAQTGLTATRASTALYRDANGIWQSAAIDTLRDAHYHCDGTASYRTTFREGAGTNSALGACSFADGTYWAGNAGFTLAAATSCISGATAYKHTALTGAVRQRIRDVGVFVNAQTDCISWILENDVANPATISTIEMYDQTAAATVHRAVLTWATKGIATQSGTGTVGVSDLGTGPNGGAMVRVYFTFTGAAAGTGGAGNTRRVYIYPTGATDNTKAIVIHHAQFEAATSVPSSPIVTVASAVTRAADLISFPWSRNPEAGTWYVDAYDLQGAATGLAPSVIAITDAGWSAAYYALYRSAGKYRNRAKMAAGASDSTAATGPAFGDRVELRGVAAISGSDVVSTLGQSINAAAEVVAAAGTARALDAAYPASSRLYVGIELLTTAYSANLAIRSIAYVPQANVSMANMRIYATTAPIMPWIQTITDTLAPFAIAAERSWFGQPSFTVEDTGTNTLLAAVATPRANQNARMFSLRVTFSAAPVVGTIVIRDGLTRIWQSEFRATGPFDYEFDFSKKPIRGSMGNDLSVTVDPAGASVVQTVSWSGDFVRSP